MTQAKQPDFMGEIEGHIEEGNREFAKRKVVQIAVGGSSMDRLYALCDDGSIWQKNFQPGGDYWSLITPRPEA
ncbi:hypothetical protein ACM79F_31430 [Pseudomonas aeruginosa]|uniref:hypothetical protein n=1 Tax=Klebsiella pneumoniae TaxID=573 RepID=UPI003ADB1903|nr:hypothetical protein [Pseudomonas aeruginosa]